MWSNVLRIPSYESNEGILNFGGKRWPLIEVVKRESVRWTKSSTGFVLLIFSLISFITFLIWSTYLSKCGILLEGVPLTEDCCMAGADWRSRWGLLEASLLSWWPGLVALDLVQTIQPFVMGGQIVRQSNCPHKRRQLMMFQELVGWMLRILVILKTWKMKTRNQRRLRLAGHKSSDDKVNFSLSFIEFLEFSRLCLEKLPPLFCRGWVYI